MCLQTSHRASTLALLVTALCYLCVQPLTIPSDVQSLLTETRSLYSSYLRIRTLSTSKSKSGPSDELLQSRSEIVNNLETLTSDVQDLLDSIRAIESNPSSYGLTIAELRRRQKFVQDVTSEIESMRRDIQTTTSTTSTTNGAYFPDPDDFQRAAGDGDDVDYDEDNYAANEHAVQQTMMREQDEQLDDIYRTVGNLRAQGEQMGVELEEQGVMLGEVDTLADRVGGKLAVGTKRIGEVLRRNEDRWSGCCIGVLIVVLMVLLLLVIVI